MFRLTLLKSPILHGPRVPRKRFTSDYEVKRDNMECSIIKIYFKFADGQRFFFKRISYAFLNQMLQIILDFFSSASVSFCT